MSVLINALLDTEEVVALIPQKPPMVMIDKLLHSDEKKSISSFAILENNIFCKENKFTEPGLIENVAQTAAIRAGYNAMQKSKGNGGEGKSGPVLGYIASVKNCVLHQLPNVGDRIETEIIVEREVLSVSLIKGTIKSNDTTLLECEMKIFQKD